MPVDVTAQASTPMFFDFGALSVVEAAPTPSIPELPDKLTQEEMKLMRIIAEPAEGWQTIKGANKPYRYLSDADRRKMASFYEKISSAETVAALFVPKKRLAELVKYAIANPAAVVYVCTKKGIR